MSCRLCGCTKKFVRAHVIPKSFYKPLSQTGQIPELRTNTPGAYPKRSPMGVYDSGILCADCERTFSPWDDYAQELLLQEPLDENYLILNGAKVGYAITAVDYEKLKLFFISMLWRATVTTQAFFKRIDVGPFEPKLRQMILETEPGDPDTFAVTIARFEDPLGKAMLDPHREKWWSVNYCRFYLGGYVAYIKVDKRPAPDFMGNFNLSPEEPLIVILRNLRKSKDFKVMQSIVKSTTFKRQPITHGK